MKPNIFDISTKELSQDAFITWLLKWADDNNKEYSSELNFCARDFVRELIKTSLPDFDAVVSKVEAGRQWNNIDVWAKVNDKYLIIIEDKTYSKRHSGQLARYKEFAEKWCEAQSPQFKKPICIYLKTGNESKRSLDGVIGKGYKVYSRPNFLRLLNSHDIKNEIYNDFKERLKRIEAANHQWEKKTIGNWGWQDWQGFYQYLEENINLVNWEFVNNPNGGFWNAVLNWSYWGIYPAYIQIEENKICFKVSTDPSEIDLPENLNRSKVRNELSQLILKSAREKNITIIKRPKRFGKGKYMTVAVVDCENWLGRKNEIIQKEKVKNLLLELKKFLVETIK